MAKYRVKEGRRFGASNEYGPGAIVELDPIDAQGFADKLELIEDTSAPALAGGLLNQLNVTTPDDLKLQPQADAEATPPEGDFKINLEEESPAPAPKTHRKKAQ